MGILENNGQSVHDKAPRIGSEDHLAAQNVNPFRNDIANSLYADLVAFRDERAEEIRVDDVLDKPEPLPIGARLDAGDILQRLREKQGLVAPQSASVDNQQLANPIEDETRVRLSETEIAAIDQQIEELFSINVSSPQFSVYTDRFHLRVPNTNEFSIEDSPASNVNLSLELMNDLRVILGLLFPQEKQVPRGWDFKRQFEASKQHINLIVNMLRSGKKYIADDLGVIDTQKEHYYTCIKKLRRTLAVVSTMREMVERRTDRSEPIVQKAMKTKVIFYLVQREQDLLTELAVTIQTYLAMDARRHTNVTLMQNIERILSTTVQALSNAVYVANNVAGETLNFVFDTRQIVLGFDGKRIKEMIDQFMEIDRDLAKMLPSPEKPQNTKRLMDPSYKGILTKTDEELEEMVKSDKLDSSPYYNRLMGKLDKTIEEADNIQKNKHIQRYS